MSVSCNGACHISVLSVSRCMQGVCWQKSVWSYPGWPLCQTQAWSPEWSSSIVGYETGTDTRQLLAGLHDARHPSPPHCAYRSEPGANTQTHTEATSATNTAHTLTKYYLIHVVVCVISQVTENWLLLHWEKSEDHQIRFHPLGNMNIWYQMVMVIHHNIYQAITLKDHLLLVEEEKSRYHKSS